MGLARKIPANLLNKHENLFHPLMSSYKQVNLMWDRIDTDWDKLSVQSMTLDIYKSVKDKEKGQLLINKLKGNKEENQLVRACLLIFSMKFYKYENSRIEDPFMRFHEMIQDYFMSHIGDVPGCELSTILPLCNHSVTSFCEGRMSLDSKSEFTMPKTNDFGKEIAFCPRKAQGCPVGEDDAQLYSDTKKPWNQWTLAELLEACGLEPSLPELPSNDIYMMKLSGWINRLKEITERMKLVVK